MKNQTRRNEGREERTEKNLRALRFSVVDFPLGTMKRLTWPILPVVFLAFGAVAQNWMDSQRRAPLAVEETLYVNSGEALKRASLGFDGLMADVYWIRTLLYFGEEFERQRGTNQYFDVSRLKLLQPLLDITVDLCPKHIPAYRFAAGLLRGIDEGAASRLRRQRAPNSLGAR